MATNPSQKHSAPDATSRSSGERLLPHVLLIEDDDAMREMLAEALREEGFVVTECDNVFRWLQFSIGGATDAACAQHGVYDIVISDIRMPIMSGMDVLQTLHETHFSVVCLPTILITAFGDRETHQRAKDLGAAAVLDKPFEPRQLIETARQVLGQ